jgi:hypothetical protein
LLYFAKPSINQVPKFFLAIAKTPILGNKKIIKSQIKKKREWIVFLKKVEWLKKKHKLFH